MSRLGRVAATATTVVGLAAVALPLYWAVVSSLRPTERLFASPTLLPRDLVLDHYRALFAARDFWTPVRNSLVVAGATTLVCVVLATLAAYALARLRMRGKPLVLGLVLGVSMFPQMTLVAPLYRLLRALGLIDTYPGLVLPYVSFALPLAVWFLTGQLRELPVELEEAARVDGASRMRVLWSIVLPLSMPSIAATAVITFVYCWNEFLFALSFTLGPERWTVPVAIALFRGQYEVPWGEILAGAIVATVPVAVLVLVAQRWVVRGLTAGALKG